MALPPKFCPDCGEEYVHTASLCVHCQVGLVLESSSGQRTPGLPPVAELRLVRLASASFVTSLSERLEAEGIAHRVEVLDDSAAATGRRRAAGNCGVFVREEDAEAALAIDASHLRTQIPDMPGDGELVEAEGGCPACGEPVREEATECPGCGLPFLEADL